MKKFPEQLFNWNVWNRERRLKSGAASLSQKTNYLEVDYDLWWTLLNFSQEICSNTFVHLFRNFLFKFLYSNFSSNHASHYIFLTNHHTLRFSHITTQLNTLQIISNISPINISMLSKFHAKYKKRQRKNENHLNHELFTVL